MFLDIMILKQLEIWGTGAQHSTAQHSTVLMTQVYIPWALILETMKELHSGSSRLMLDLQRKFEEIIRKWNRANIGTLRKEKVIEVTN